MKKYLLFYFLLFSMQTYFSQEARYINTELLNVRSGPGKNYEVLDTAPKGEKVTILSAKGNWSHIQMDSGIKGFVSSKFLLTDAPISKSKKKDSGTWWKAILGTIGFLFLVKLFGGKKPSSHRSSPKPTSLERQGNPQPLVTLRPPKEVFTCKFCGVERNTVYTLTNGKCKNSPNGNHQPFEGSTMKIYSCKFCGLERNNIYTLTNGSCKISTNGHHQPYEGSESNKYCCKYCGLERNTIYTLTNGSCKLSPNGHHQPFI